MKRAKFEYLWLDGYTPSANIRGKTKVLDIHEGSVRLEDVPEWSFDGSSTKQAVGHDSDCILKPVALFHDPARTNGYLVWCEVMLPDGSPHPSNVRTKLSDDSELWLGFEQEYFLLQEGKPLGSKKELSEQEQGTFYTGVGYENMGAVARRITEEHLDQCLQAKIGIAGINAEVARGQWEFQIFAKGAKKAGDHLWVARYLLIRLCEQYGVEVSWHCKPLGPDWNGSGMHTNFSTKRLREKGGKAYFERLMKEFKKNHKAHIQSYGPHNELRLTGIHETQSIDTFSYGIADRGASIRLPHVFVNEGYKGYIEDRRPSSEGDPYQIANRILLTIKTVK